MIDFDYRIRKSARRKTLSICVYPDNRVVVAAPVRLSKEEIVRFVEKKSDWVRKRLNINREKKNKKPRQFVTGEKLLLLGREYTLKVQAGPPGDVFMENGSIAVPLPPAASPEEDRINVRNRLATWYVGLALKKIKERLPLFAKEVGASPRRVTIKAMKSRWGSCSSRGSISFAWNIIMAPEPVLDYLVVHELCHLVHHDHSAEYWELVGSVIPDYSEKRKWLRQNGEALNF